MKEKINLGILFGGRSCEHEVSVTSAKSILKALNQDKYNVHLIGIDKSGRWHLGADIDALTHEGSVAGIEHQSPVSTSVSLELHETGNLMAQNTSRTPVDTTKPPTVDVLFPVLHGTYGEDGAMQGAMEMAGLPYVGCGVAASALAMDKALAKKIFEAENIPQAAYHISYKTEWHNNPDKVIEDIESGIGYDLFIKPANMGSSVGVSKATNRNELVVAINHALDFDNKIVIEESMDNCQEIECAVLGNDSPEASILGEIIPGAAFYNYETKYLDDKSQLVIPAPLDQTTTQAVQKMALTAFKAIDGSGLARVDFFVHKDSNAIVLNEVNTLPGFTPISMYPQLWTASGLPYDKLIDKLIELALDNHQSKQALKRAF